MDLVRTLGSIVESILADTEHFVLWVKLSSGKQEVLYTLQSGILAHTIEQNWTLQGSLWQLEVSFSKQPDLAWSNLFLNSLRLSLQTNCELEQIRVKAHFDERIIRSMSSGFLVLQPDLTITHANPAGAKMLGSTAPDLIGQRLDNILVSRVRVKDIFETGIPIVDEEMTIKLKNRSLRIMKTSVPVYDDMNNIVAVLDHFKEIKEAHRLVTQMAGSQVRYSFQDIIYVSENMRQTVELGQKAATSELSVLICGESGTGKELFAQAIHSASSRSHAPFIVIDCASMPRDLIESELFGYVEGAFTGALKGGRPGKFELADGGTIFLDELGELPLELQSRLLRVLQSHQVTRLGSSEAVSVDIRVIAATNRDLQEQIAQKNFRSDLFYRLNVLSIFIPALRTRPEDVLVLAEAFLQKYQWKMSRENLYFSPEAQKMLRGWSWPGNVRELENTIARAVQICQNCVQVEDLLLCSPSPTNLEPQLNSPKLTAAQVQHAIDIHQGNVAAAARSLGVARSTIYKKLKR